MSVNLQKGQTVNLQKGTEFDLSTLTIGLGWDVAEPPKKGFFASMFSAEEEFDLDAIAFLLDQNDKIISLGEMRGGQPTLVGGDVVFFNSKRHPSGAIWSSGDNLTGAGAGDDEQIIVKLDQLPAQYHKILFMVCIYRGTEKNQSFARVKNSFIRAVDAQGKEVCRYNISANENYANSRSMIFAQVVRQGNDWKLEALGNPVASDSFVEILTQYLG